jgi:hypothetical protein
MIAAHPADHRLHVAVQLPRLEMRPVGTVGQRR